MIAYIAKIGTRLSLVSLLIFTMTAPSAIAQTAPTMNYPPDPLLEEAPSTITDAELGSIGCLVASATVSGSMLYLMGGLGNAFGSLTPPLHPAIVLEGSAAVAFVLSSACYIGVAMAPLAVSTYNSLSERFTQTLPPRPLYAPGELWAIGNGMTPQQPYETVPQPAYPQQPYAATAQPTQPPYAINAPQQQPPVATTSTHQQQPPVAGP